MSATASNRIARRPFVAELLAKRGDALIVCGLGSPTWDAFAAGDSPDYLYSWGGMGLAVPTALGVALAQPARRVVCVTGDGEMLMGIGALGVVADQAPTNLGILVLDNESFGETGRQRGLTADRTDIAAVAGGFGIARTLAVTEQGAVPELAEFLFKTPGPVLATAKIALSDDPWALPEKDGAAIAYRFRGALGVDKS
jgi:thiamine pyrophosphate-dependent acetolactate synthase large subunit-like protein